MTGTAERSAPGTAPERGVERVLYGRRKGRPLRAGQQALMDRLLPRIEIATPPPGAAIDPRSLFDFAPTAAWLEIGFGAGEHIAALARANSSIAMIGCEPFLNGVARLLTTIDRDGLGNIRIFRDDARLLLAALTPECIQRAFVLFPDPWPKARHHKRRFVSPDNIARLARVLSDGAELRVATDDSGYLAWILEHSLACDDFQWMARRATDWRVRPADWPATRYETKAIASGRRCAYFRFRRKPRQH